MTTARPEKAAVPNRPLARLRFAVCDLSHSHSISGSHASPCNWLTCSTCAPRYPPSAKAVATAHAPVRPIRSDARPQRYAPDAARHRCSTMVRWIDWWAGSRSHSGQFRG